MKKVILSTSLCILLAACGGGGGGGGGGGSDDNSPFFAGVWRGDAKLLDDNCGIADTVDIPFLHNVNQDGSRVVLDVQGGASFAGAVNDKKNGFDVSQPSSVSGNCVTNSALSYVVSESDQNAAGVAFGIVSTCGILECRVTYVGNAIRDH